MYLGNSLLLAIICYLLFFIGLSCRGYSAKPARHKTFMASTLTFLLIFTLGSRSSSAAIAILINLKNRDFLYFEMMLLLFITISNYNEIYSFRPPPKSARPVPGAPPAPPANQPAIGDEEEKNLFSHELYSSSPSADSRQANHFDDVLFNENDKRSSNKYYDNELPDKDLGPKIKPSKQRPERPDDHSLEL